MHRFDRWPQNRTGYSSYSRNGKMVSVDPGKKVLKVSGFRRNTDINLHWLLSI